MVKTKGQHKVLQLRVSEKTKLVQPTQATERKDKNTIY